MNIFSKIARTFRTYALAEDEDEEQHGEVNIITTRGRMRFSAELINVDDYNRAIDLLIEERGILFPDYDMV